MRGMEKLHIPKVMLSWDGLERGLKNVLFVGVTTSRQRFSEGTGQLPLHVVECASVIITLTASVCRKLVCRNM